MQAIIRVDRVFLLFEYLGNIIEKTMCYGVYNIHKSKIYDKNSTKVMMG